MSSKNGSARTSRNDLNYERERPLLSEHHENEYEMRGEEDDEPRYLEPTQRFPMPSDRPMLQTTQANVRTNIRTNPNYPSYKHTQV